MPKRVHLPKIQIKQVVLSFSVGDSSEKSRYDWGLIDLNIPEVHKKTMGEGIRIGVVDSGRPEHSDVVNNVALSKNFSSSSNDLDSRGHSTFICGLIAAEKNNKGVVGVAPSSKLYVAKVIDDTGTGDPMSLVKGIEWCIEQNVHIISISAGMFFDFAPLRKIIQKAYKQNIIIISAVGNRGKENSDIAFPARYPEVIGVAAYNQNHKAADFSSRGVNVFCAMPGVDIFSCWLNNEYVKSSGSSFACPIMSGICALILSYHLQNMNDKTPCANPKEMMTHLKKYAKKLNDVPNAVGFGTIDATKMFLEKK